MNNLLIAFAACDSSRPLPQRAILIRSLSELQRKKIEPLVRAVVQFQNTQLKRN